MALSAKPTSYTVNTGHAKCPDHLYMLDEASGATAADGVGTLDLTVQDTANMWQTDATYGTVLRCGTGDYAISGQSFSASTGVCFVVIAKSASTVNPGSPETLASVGDNSVANSYHAAQFNSSGFARSTYDDASIVLTSKAGTTDYYDNTWHMIAARAVENVNDIVVTVSVDGGAWLTTSTNTGAGWDTLIDTLAIGARADSTPGNPFNGDILSVFVYKDDGASWDDAWIASLWSDPWQFLDQNTIQAFQYQNRVNTLLRM